MTAATPTWLVDKSAYMRLGDGPDAPEWAERIERGLVRIERPVAALVGEEQLDFDGAVLDARRQVLHRRLAA